MEASLQDPTALPVGPRPRTADRFLVTDRPPSPSSLLIAHRLRAARRLAHLTQQQLAGERFSRRSISALERGKVPPSLETVQVLARWLGLPVAYFVAEPLGGLSEITEQHRLRRTGRARPVRQDALLRMLGEAEALLRQRAADAALEVLGSATPAPALSRLHHPRWHWLCGWALGIRRQPQEAMTSFQQGLAVAEALQEQVPAPYGRSLAEMTIRLRTFLGYFAIECDQPQQAVACLQPCLAALLDGLVQNVDLELGVYLVLGEASLLAGLSRAAIHYYEAANQRLDGLQRPLVSLRIQWGLARAHWGAGDVLLAKRYAQQVLALDLADRRVLAARVHTLLGRILLQLGEQRKAEWHLRQGLGGALRTGDPHTRGVALGSLAEFFLSRKAYERARALVCQGLEAREQLSPQVEGYLRLMLAQIYQGTQDPAGERTFQEAIGCCERTTDQLLQGRAHEAYGNFLAEQGRFAEAYHHLCLANGDEQVAPGLNRL